MADQSELSEEKVIGKQEHDIALPSECQLEISYIYIKVLGRGAFGEAVLYRKTEDNSLVVWKEVVVTGLSEKEVLEAQMEVEILSMLNHANIVSYYNHFLDTDTMFIEMEYANGGTLHSRILNQKDLLQEEMVIWYMYQLLSAVAYIHELGILHRDIKTINIFSTRTDLIKLGDFGISKVLENKSQMADTFVGTPYYMSPELVKGDRYNYKSDVWALGCVLYELLTLSKPFYATNPLKLAHEIVSVDSEEISSVYSRDLCQLSKDMLNKEADCRPSVDEVLKHPSFTKGREAMEQKIWQLNSPVRRARLSAASMSETIPVVTSKTSEVYQWGGGRKTPHRWEMLHGGKGALQVATGRGHFAVVTVEKELYTWAAGQGNSTMCGQLGHGDLAEYKAPRVVSSLTGVSVRQAGCGDAFTICVTDDGKAYSFGSDSTGCLGIDQSHGTRVLLPTVISVFNLDPVAEISCGDTHVVALTSSNHLYTWGTGEFGCLGLGSEDDFATPQKVNLRGHYTMKHVRAGTDGSFIISMNGRVFACGSNECNKLGFNSSALGLRKTRKKVSYDIQCKKTFSLVKSLNCHHIIDLSPGHTHTAAIDLYGFLYTFGSNKHGQLGVGDTRPHPGVCKVRGELMSQRVCGVACGDGFTLASTTDDQIYAWGNAQNGRLGMVASESGATTIHDTVSSPRPIFGSLHVVPMMSSRHWYTLIVAEKILHRKAVKVRVSSPKSANMEDSRDCPFIADPLRKPSSCTKESGRSDLPDGEEGDPVTRVMEGTVLPDWLRNEMLQAEYIPALKVNEIEVTTPPQNATNNPEAPSIDIVTSLQQRIISLEEQNTILSLKNEQLENIVSKQESSICELNKELQSKCG